MGESQSRSVMLHHQDQQQNSTYGGSAHRSKDNNFNFLPAEGDDGLTGGRGRGDENRNPARPRTLTVGREPSSGFHMSVASPRSRLPCWSRLEPLPEIESGDDGYGRVPPDGAEERRVEEGAPRRGQEKKKRHQEDEEEPDDEWGDSESESGFSCRSEGSASSVTMESGAEAALMAGWDRVGVGESGSAQQELMAPGIPRRSSACTGGSEEDLRNHDDQQSSDSDGELMDAVWTLRDRERFKEQEMEKHQVQLTMYRRLALIRWVRTLQSRVQEQQNRLQSSFDVILTHRKELLRMGATAAAVSQS